ncbi:MAG: CpsD/CapB family tyrosine-protein kinase [Gordonibacter sp.]|uniref:CpsD/CapB family tyrosine-protein kinase n=1 Tax=Gordonibacter sp. TaxID=1968902 RepID=UPI002FC74DFD
MDTLHANLNFMSLDKPLRSLVITSSVPNEGKTDVAVGLAHTMAASGKRTLIVECDLRRRSLAGRLGIRPPVGLGAVVLGDAKLEQAAVQTGQRNLWFLDAEHETPNPSDLLDSMGFGRLLSAAEHAYDRVIIDTPPVGAFVDAAVVSSRVDATIMVVRQRFVRRSSVKQAVDQLEKAGAYLVGTVVSFCDSPASKDFRRTCH